MTIRKSCISSWRGTLDACYAEIRAIQHEARNSGFKKQPVWPMIVLRTPKGWTCPKEVDGIPIEGTFRAHQVPLATVRENPEHLKILETWMRSYKPEELFDERGAFIEELAELAPRGNRRMGGSPHVNGGRLLYRARPSRFYGLCARDSRAGSSGR